MSDHRDRARVNSAEELPPEPISVPAEPHIFKVRKGKNEYSPSSVGENQVESLVRD